MGRARRLKGFATGAVLEYLFDPREGERRRAMLRDKMMAASTKTMRFMRAARRDMRNRSIGVAGMSRGALDDLRRRAMGEPVDDPVLVERVRERLGHIVAQPRQITVRADAGTVTLEGSIFDAERDRAIAEVRRVRGVRAVHDTLTSTGGAPDPAAMPPPATMSTRMLGHWSPTARVLAGSAGAVMTIKGLRRGGPVGKIAEIAGLGLLARGFTRNAEPGAELIGMAAGTTGDPDTG